MPDDLGEGARDPLVEFVAVSVIELEFWLCSKLHVELILEFKWPYPPIIRQKRLDLLDEPEIHIKYDGKSSPLKGPHFLAVNNEEDQ